MPLNENIRSDKSSMFLWTMCTPEESVPSFQIISIIPSGFPNWDDILTPFLKTERETSLSSKNDQAPTGCDLKSSAKICVTNRRV